MDEHMAGNEIYSSYAFSENESEKAKHNKAVYKELTEKYKVYRHDTKIDLVDGEDCNFSDYDVVIGRKFGYHHALYYVYKNEPNLSTAELALICDHGRLCFGYSMHGIYIRVSED